MRHVSSVRTLYNLNMLEFSDSCCKNRVLLRAAIINERRKPRLQKKKKIENYGK